MYSASSPILGLGQASAVDIELWFVSRGPDYAQGYAPDGQYKPPPADLGLAIVAECQRYASVGIVVNQDLCAGQILDETAAWQSKYARERNNPGGIGSTNDNPDGALTYPSVAAGVRGHVAHMLNYAVGRGTWSADDPRTENIASAGWLGIAHVLSDLNGRWAFPGTTYGQTIAALANDLVTHSQGTPGGATVTIPKPPVDTSYTAVNYFTDNRHVEAIVWHISQGTDSRSWLAGKASGVSANYLIERDGTIYELVEPHTRSAWANGPINQPDLSNPVIAGWVAASVNPNRRTVSIEHEGMSSHWQGGSLTQAQVDAHIRLTAWLCQEFGLAPDRTHIIGHYQINDVDKHDCPGFSDAEWGEWVAAVAALVNGGQQAPPASDLRLFPETGHSIGHGFRSYWETNGGLPIFGFPLTDEVIENGMATQYFERSVFEWHPDAGVLLRRLGAEAAKAAGYTGAGI